MAYYYGELYHHGILGMHWGKRNGPPYPLDGSDHSASEKKAGWRKSLGSGGGSVSAKRKRKDDKKESNNSSGGNGVKVYREEDNNKANYEEKKRSVTYESGSKGVKDMSNKELQDAINRMRLENDYARLTTADKDRFKSLNDAESRIKSQKNIRNQLNKLKPEEKFERTKLDVSNIPKQDRQNAINAHNKKQDALEKQFNSSKNIKRDRANVSSEAISSANKLAKIRNEANQVKLQNEARNVAKEMDYKDLKATVDRLNMEKQYKELAESQQKKSGEVYVKNALEITGAVLAVAVPAYQLYNEVKKSKRGD